MTKTKTIHIIGGPTASGKSGLALTMAAEKNGLIINADSMQVYDGLPILTAQPSEEDKAQAPHALYGVRHPNDPCSAGNWREMVEPVIAEALEAGQTPIVVGGSGLYIKSLIEGLSPIPDIPDEVRQAANRKQAELGNPAFHAELQKRDPAMAEKFHPYHTARLIRAWEVLEATGKSLAEWQKEPLIGPPEEWRFDITLVMPERDVLYERCNTRLETMLENGALEEVEAFGRKLGSADITPGVPLSKALGLSPLMAHLGSLPPDNDHIKLNKEGEKSEEPSMTLAEAITRAQGQTRRYAKRQVTWFRHQIKSSDQISVKATE